MKKVILLSFILVLPGIIFAQTTDCPFGFVDDQATGTCARYIDTGTNTLCDLSELPLAGNIDKSNTESTQYISEEKLRAKTVGETASIYGIDQNEYAANLAKYLGKGVLTTDSLQVLYDRNGLCAGVAAEIALSIKNPSAGSSYSLNNEDNKIAAELDNKISETSGTAARHKLILIFIILLFFYISFHFFMKFKKKNQE